MNHEDEVVDGNSFARRGAGFERFFGKIPWVEWAAAFRSRMRDYWKMLLDESDSLELLVGRRGFFGAAGEADEEHGQ